MCEYCGCKGVAPIGELMEEHVALLDEAERVRVMLASRDREGALARLSGLVGHLRRHVRREEDGIFAALRAQGDFTEEVEQLEGEHEALDASVAALDPDAPGFDQRLAALFDELAEHIEREDLGVFPVSVVTLGATGWGLVDSAHSRFPSFLRDDDDPGPVDRTVAAPEPR